jgi:hypothetical protein
MRLVWEKNRGKSGCVITKATDDDDDDDDDDD